MPYASFSMLDGPGGTAKNSSKLNKFLRREVNQLIQHIIVQDQDGQNNNTTYMSDIAYIGRLMSRKDGDTLVINNSLSLQ